MIGIERKRNFIISVLYGAIVIALFYAFFKYALGLFLPFLFAIFVAHLLQRPVNFICSKTPLKRGVVSVFFVLLCSVTLFFLIAMAFAWLIGEVKDFFQYLFIQLEDIPAFIAKIESVINGALSFLPDKLENAATAFVSEKLNGLLNSSDKSVSSSVNFDFSMLATPLLGIFGVIKQIPTTLISIIVAVIACCFMTSDYETVKKVILSIFKDETREKVVRAKRLLFPALGKMAKAYGLIIIITFSELLLGFFMLRLMGIYKSDYIIIICGIIAIIDIIPVLGTGTVLIPWAAISLIFGNIPLAIGIFIMYVCITVIRQIIEPKLVAAQLGIPAFATIMAMFIGSKLFGFIGLFLLPITVVMIKMLNDEGIINIFHKLEKDKPIVEAKEEEE